jgi:hypothetical protein
MTEQNAKTLSSTIQQILAELGLLVAQAFTIV